MVTGTAYLTAVVLVETAWLYLLAKMAWVYVFAGIATAIGNWMLS